MRDTPFLCADGMSSLLPAAPQPSVSPDQDLYQQVFENAADAYFLLDETGRLDGNQAFLKFLGSAREEPLVSLAAISPPTQPDGTNSETKAAEWIALAYCQACPPFPWRFRRTDGTDVVALVTLQRINSAGRCVLHGTVRRQSPEDQERRRLEEALRDTARGVSATTGDTFFRSLVAYLSRALEADYAFIGELSGGSSIQTTAVCVDGQIVPNFEYSLLHTPCANVVSDTAGSDVCAYSAGVRNLFPNDPLLGEMGVEAYVGTSLFDSAGRVLGLLVVLFRRPIHALDVIESMLQVFAARAAAELERLQTERAREATLAALRESEERFKSTFERSAIGMSIVGLDDRFLQVNDAFCSLMGYTAAEMTQLTTEQISNPDDLRELRKTRANTRHLHAGNINSFQVEKRYRHKEGHYFWALVGISLVRDTDGNLTHYITQVQDISERKRAEAERSAAMDELRRANELLEARVQERTAELERDRALLEAVLRQMPAGVIVAEAPSGRLLLGNQQMTRLLCGAADEFTSIDDLSRSGMVHHDGRPYSLDELPTARALYTGEVVQDEEINILRRDGTQGVLLVSSSPIYNDQGEIVAAVGTGQDITDRKRTEEALRRLHNELEMQVLERTVELERANSTLQTEVQERKRAEQVSRGQTQTLARTLNSLTARPDTDIFLRFLVEAIQEQLQADSLGFEQYDAVRDRTISRFSYVGGQLLDREKLTEWGVISFLPAAEDATWQAILADPRPFGIYDVEQDPRLIYRDQFLQAGVQSVLVVPMMLGESPVGYLFINHQQPRRYGPDEIELAVALAQQATLALQFESLAAQGEEAAVLGERNRLAREIHDTLAQGFAGILIHLQLAEAAMTRKPERALPALIQARDLAKSSLAEARRSVQALRPTALDQASLPEAIRRMANGMTAGTALRSQMEVRGVPCPLPSETEDHLLRVAQEAINNTIKYANANEVSLLLFFDSGVVSLTIHDDGEGFVPGGRPRGGGFGLIGMRERLQALRGSLTIESAPGQGTKITAVVPVLCQTERNG
jgi:PAS domain S-box-containing protein